MTRQVERRSHAIPITGRHVSLKTYLYTAFAIQMLLPAQCEVFVGSKLEGTPWLVV